MKKKEEELNQKDIKIKDEQKVINNKEEEIKILISMNLTKNIKIILNLNLKLDE